MEARFVAAVVVAVTVVAAVVVAAGVAGGPVASGAAGGSVSRCKSSDSFRLSSAAICAAIQLCKAAYRKVDGCKGCGLSLPTDFVRMRADSVRISSVVLPYSHIIPLATASSVVWWYDSRNDFSSRLRGQSQSLSWSRNALQSLETSARVLEGLAIEHRRYPASPPSASARIAIRHRCNMRAQAA